MIAIPGLGSGSVSEIADFVELECLRKRGGPVSTTDIGRVLGRGSAIDDDKLRPAISDAFSDLVLRSEGLGDGGLYPFRLSPGENFLKLSSMDGNKSILYQYLLFATRFNMSSNRRHADEDGTLLFEVLCSEVARNYFSSSSSIAESLVFGTGRYSKMKRDDQAINRRGFRASVDELCIELGEGGKFYHHTKPSPITAKDGRLDVVVWKEFGDGRANKFIGMGQCKTGSNWRGSVDSLQPESFIRKWILTCPAHLPIRMFFVAERIITEWDEVARDTGLLFDRFRILEYADRISPELMTRIRAWVRAARRQLQLWDG